jgi:dTDP-4-dehydrorhamnose 3,5-epimerase
MKIIDIKTLEHPEIKVIKFARFQDERGYFTETYRKSDLLKNIKLPEFKDVEFTQFNEAYSKADTFRGMHFQYEPYMSKLVRCIRGNLIDLVMDIRIGSPYFGKIFAYELSNNVNNDFDEWIWVPAGFAHGTLLTEPTTIEYLCTGHYSPDCQVSVSVLSKDIIWNKNDVLNSKVFNYINSDLHISEKDRNAMELSKWKVSKEANDYFMFNNFTKEL